MSNRLPPPTHLEPEYLYHKYKPLRMSVFQNYMNSMNSQADKSDLLGVIDMIFLQLVKEYDPTRGVDFPLYIKKMLNLRVHHYVQNHYKRVNKEVFQEEFIIQDDSYDDIINELIDLYSLDSEIVLGDKHRELLIGVLIRKKTLKELADEEGVPPDRLHARLYFLIKKLRAERERLKQQWGDDMYE